MSELYSQLCYRGYTANYRFLGQHWHATLKRDDAPYILSGPEIVASPEEGEAVLVKRIKAHIDHDIDERAARERS